MYISKYIYHHFQTEYVLVRLLIVTYEKGIDNTHDSDKLMKLAETY